MALSFGIVLFVLARYAFPAVLRGVEKRRRHIADSLEAARQAGEKLAQADARAQQILDAAHKESLAVMQQARKAGDAAIEQAGREASEQAGRKLAAASAEIGEMKRRAMDEVMGQIAGLSVKIAGKVVGNELDDMPGQMRLIDKLLDEEKAGRG